MGQYEHKNSHQGNGWEILGLDDIAEALNGIVETMFPKYNRKVTELLHDCCKVTPNLISQVAKDEDVMKILKDAYKDFAKAALNPENDSWKSKLQRVMTTEGIKFVKNEYVEDAKKKWPL